MPLFEIRSAEELTPFRQLHGGSELYEREIEELFWNNSDDFIGEPLFRIRRQASIGSGGKPDIVALDRNAHVVVIEIKRDVDRSQLAQCLEYAGWARTTNLDEIATIYVRGPEEFFKDWQEFTESSAPVRISQPPRLVLVARDFHGRTASAFEFLVESGLPVTLIRVSIYEDQQGRRFLDVEGEHEPEIAIQEATVGSARRGEGTRRVFHAVRLTDLLDAGLITPGQSLIWERPRLGKVYRATVLDNGGIQTEDGRVFSSPSAAAQHAGNVIASDGWYAWRLDDAEKQFLHKLREKYVERARAREIEREQAQEPTDD